jgi:hypothetical protein
MIRAAMRIEVQPFRNEGKAVVPWRCRRAFSHEIVSKKVNGVPSCNQKLKPSRCCLRFSRAHLDRQSVFIEA